MSGITLGMSNTVSGASNALVAVVGFYAQALQDAHMAVDQAQALAKHHQSLARAVLVDPVRDRLIQAALKFGDIEHDYEDDALREELIDAAAEYQNRSAAGRAPGPGGGPVVDVGTGGDSSHSGSVRGATPRPTKAEVGGS